MVCGICRGGLDKRKCPSGKTGQNTLTKVQPVSLTWTCGRQPCIGHDNPPEWETCCRDGITAANGKEFSGCPDRKLPGQMCQTPSQAGNCTNHQVKWFYDQHYGGCNRYSRDLWEFPGMTKIYRHLFYPMGFVLLLTISREKPFTILTLLSHLKM